MSDGKKKLSFLTVISTIICVVFVCEAAAPAAAIGNQQFFWATRPVADAISGACGAKISYVQGRPVLRFVTSWATTAADVDELIAFVRTL